MNTCWLFQAGYLFHSHSFTLWRLSLDKKSHCSAPTLAVLQPTYSGSDWPTDSMPVVSLLCPLLIVVLPSVMDFKILNLRWHPTPLCYFSKLNKWIHLTLGYISVESWTWEGQRFILQHIWRFNVRFFFCFDFWVIVTKAEYPICTISFFQLTFF